MGTSILITGLFIASAVIYCVQFSRNILSLRSVRGTSDLAASLSNQILQGCVNSETLGPCVEVPLANVLLGRRMELAFASLVQMLIFITDLLLVRPSMLF